MPIRDPHGSNFNNSYSNCINIATQTLNLTNVHYGDSTYSAWYYPRSVPTNADTITFNDVTHGMILIKQGFHYGLHYNALKKLVLYTYNSSNVSRVAMSTNTFPPDKWYHVVGIQDITNGYLYIYVNGKLEGTNNVGLNYTVRNYGTDTWKIGTAKSSSGYAYPAHGIIDEVAIWGRALSGVEVLQLYRRGVNRVKYQLRSCTTDTCSDQEALTNSGGGWMAQIIPVVVTFQNFITLLTTYLMLPP